MIKCEDRTRGAYNSRLQVEKAAEHSAREGGVWTKERETAAIEMDLTCHVNPRTVDMRSVSTIQSAVDIESERMTAVSTAKVTILQRAVM